MDVWDQLRYFVRAEFRHPDRMSEALLLKLDEVRHQAGVAIRITSDFRPGDGGAHGRGMAVDIAAADGINGRWRFLVLRAALAEGFCRVGVYDSHLHLDVDEQLAQDVAWWGISR